MVDAARIAAILRQARQAADRAGRKTTRLEDLDAAAVSDLAQATLDHLRSRPGVVDPVTGWTTVQAMQAGVMPWWTGLLGEPNDTPEINRLRPLRRDVYDYLEDELGLIRKLPGQGSAVEVSPPEAGSVAWAAAQEPVAVIVSAAGAGYGTAEQNKRVEMAAMAKVCEQFVEWHAHDVSADKCGWDITLTREDDEIHAEVKGCRGAVPQVLLTANEMIKAQSDPLWQLMIVTTALDHPQLLVVDREQVAAAATPYVYRFQASGLG